MRFFTLAARDDPMTLNDFLAQHHGEILILVLTALLFIELLIIVPQLLRAHLRKAEMLHTEQMKALEKGIPCSREDERSRVAGRTAMLVPIVVVICAGTVTCFLAASHSDNLTTVALTVWVVSGVVSLAAITGGVALIGRLAQLQNPEVPDEEGLPGNPLEP